MRANLVLSLAPPNLLSPYLSYLWKHISSMPSKFSRNLRVAPYPPSRLRKFWQNLLCNLALSSNFRAREIWADRHIHPCLILLYILALSSNYSNMRTMDEMQHTPSQLSASNQPASSKYTITYHEGQDIYNLSVQTLARWLQHEFSIFRINQQLVLNQDMVTERGHHLGPWSGSY